MRLGIVIWQSVGRRDKVLSASTDFNETGEKRNGYTKEKEDGEVGKEHESLRGAEEEGRGIKEDEHGRSLREGREIEADKGCRSEAAEGLHENRRSVSCEDREHENDQVEDIHGTEGNVLLEQGEVAWSGRTRRMAWVGGESGNVQRRNERGELQKDGRGEKADRCGWRNIRTGLPSEAGRCEDTFQEPIHHGYRTGWTHEIVGVGELEEVRLAGVPLVGLSVFRRAA